jgi:hypothetical protein
MHSFVHHSLLAKPLLSCFHHLFCEFLIWSAMVNDVQNPSFLEQITLSLVGCLVLNQLFLLIQNTNNITRFLLGLE